MTARQPSSARSDHINAVDPEHFAVVHADAGTGKTWLLTSRIIRLLLSGTPPGAILAITFTRKAANEIETRLIERLMALAICDDVKLPDLLTEIGAPTDGPTRVAARELYENYLSAIQPLRATTFHAFCQEVLRRFPLEAEVPPGFAVVDDTSEIEDFAWLALDRRASRNPRGGVADGLDTLLRECGGVASTRRALKQFLDHRSDWWAYTEDQNDPESFASEQLRQTLGIQTTAWPLDSFLQNLDLRHDLQRYLDLMTAHPTPTNRLHVEHLNQVLSQTITAEQAFARIRLIFLTAEDELRQLKRTKTLEHKLGGGKSEELVRLHAEIGARVKSTLAETKRLDTWRLSQAWYRCGAAYLEEFQRIKQEQGVLDFADLEWMTYRLLHHSRQTEWVQYKLDQRIEHLLVDEFQDTNPTQWRLLLPLLQEMTAGDPERRRSVFLVGDEKQSIYRFRRADPRLFRAARDWLQENAGAHVYEQRLSWRSAPAITTFVNLIFHQPANEPTTPEEEYYLPNFERHGTQHRQLWGHVELLPLVRRARAKQKTVTPAWRNPLEQPRLTDDDQRYREESDIIAAKVRQILGIPITDGSVVRPLTGRDIIILLRDRTNARYYEEALQRADIPYSGAGRGAFYDALEIRDLIALIRALIEPYNDLALATVLRSPLFDATEEDLVRLARLHPGPWRERLPRVPADSSIPLARAHTLLTRWNHAAGLLPAHDLLDRIYAEGNVIERFVAAAPPHLRGRVEANLNYLLELALDIDSGRYPSLSHFLAYLENYAEDGRATAEPTWNRAPRVRVMTIHAAKGLEAHAVFLADAARAGISHDRGPRPLIEWPENMPSPTNFYLLGAKKSIDNVSQAISETLRRSAHREESNLLYVALTRAKQMLFISGCEPGQGGRGWYGFIERRLQHAADTGAAASVGLRISTTLRDDKQDLHGSCATLESGTPPVLTPLPATTAPAYAIDPALTRPMAHIHKPGTLLPSEATNEEIEDSVLATDNSELSSKGRLRGILIHRMLAQLASGKSRHAIERRLRLECSDQLSEFDFTRWWREACAVVDHPPFAELFDPARFLEARNEIPILYRNNDRDVFGVIDRIILREQEIVALDYKTHTLATRANAIALAAAFREQMRLYGEGVRRLWPEKRLRLMVLFTICRELIELTV